MSAHCHSHSHSFESDLFSGNNPVFRRALILVILINALMFFLEVGAGYFAASQALLADSLDFLADTLTYSLSLGAIGFSLIVRARVALFKALSLVLMGSYVMITTIHQIFILEVPQAGLMGGVGILALIANMLSVLLLYRWRNGESNIRSVWLCSRNDALGNIAVILAAFGVFGTGTAWPDLIVAGIMSSLFLSSAVRIFLQARSEIKGCSSKP